MSGIQTTEGARVSPVRFVCRGHFALRRLRATPLHVPPLPPPKRVLPMLGKNRENLPRLGKIGMETEAALHEVGGPQATGRTTLAKAWQNLPEVRHPAAPAFSLSGPLPLR